MALSGCLTITEHSEMYSFPAQADQFSKIVEALVGSLGSKVEWVNTYDARRQAKITPVERKWEKSVPVVVVTYLEGKGTVYVQKRYSQENEGLRAVRHAIEEALTSAGIKGWRVEDTSWDVPIN